MFNVTDMLEVTKPIKKATSNMKQKEHKRRDKTNFKYRVIFDDDLEDYVKNIKTIYDKPKARFINSLLRRELNTLLGTKNLKGNDLLEAWLKYKEKNNIQTPTDL